jgi:hypothetical protein
VKHFRRTEGRFPLEAALVHARNLIDFFWTPTNKRKAHSDGIYAAHFYRPARAWQRLLANGTQRPSQLYDALSAQVAHISVMRSRRDVVVSFSAEELDRLASDLELVWNQFLAGLGTTRWRSRLQTRAGKWRQAK